MREIHNKTKEWEQKWKKKREKKRIENKWGNKRIEIKKRKKKGN